MTPQTIEKVKQETAKHFGVTVEDLVSKRRAKIISHPRHIAMTVARRITAHSLPTIGRAFGDRDHTTILYACDKIETEARQDFRLAKILEAIAHSVTAGMPKIVRNDIEQIARRLAPLITSGIRDELTVHPAQQQKLPDPNAEIHAAISTVLITHRQWQSEYYNRCEPFARQRMDKAVSNLRNLHAELFKEQSSPVNSRERNNPKGQTK